MQVRRKILLTVQEFSHGLRDSPYYYTPDSMHAGTCMHAIGQSGGYKDSVKRK